LKMLLRDINHAPDKFQVSEHNCCGCLHCMVVCAEIWGEGSSLNSARVKVCRNTGDYYGYSIYFDSDCRSGCKLCAKWCPYGALQVKEG